MKISAISIPYNYLHTPSFHSKNNKVSQKSDSFQKNDENPISRKGETFKLITGTFVAGLAVGAKLLLELVEDGDWVLDTFASKSKKVADKYGKESEKAKKETEKIKNETLNNIKKNSNKKILAGIGAFISIVAASICGFALLYTGYKAPKIAYESKVNTFKKSKEMDAYIEGNKAEASLYTEIAQNAKETNPEDMEKLKQQYAQMKLAKNQVPDFINTKKIKNPNNNIKKN